MIYFLALIVALLLGVGILSFSAKREARGLRGDAPKKRERSDSER